MSHQDSVNSNLEVFREKVKSYDTKPAIGILTDLFALSMLQFDVAAPRKSVAETEEPITESQLPGLWEAINKGKRSSLIKEDTTIIDFACGTGLVAQKLAPYMPKGEIIGVDISQFMLDEFEAKGSALKTQYPDFKTSAVCGDVLDPSFDWSLVEGKADIVVCSLAFHHFHDYHAVCNALKRMAKPGGWLMIYDLYNEDQEPGAVTRELSLGVSRHGLTLEELNLSLQEGCTNVSSAREYLVEAWQDRDFIDSHCCQDVIDNLQNAKQKDGMYLVNLSIVLGVAQRK